MASEQGHTPTPWIAVPTGPVMEGYSQPYGVAQANARNLVCGCFGDVEGGPDVARANAAFIVRAANCHDDLVKALERLIHPDGGEEDDIRAARAALTKATQA